MFGMGMGKMGLAKSAVAFAVSSLFANNEQGVWYAPSDINLAWRRNLLTRTEEFDNAAWVKTAVLVTPNGVTAPDGSSNADVIIPNTSLADHRVEQAPSLAAGNHVLTVYAKYAGHYLGLVINGNGRIFDLQAGTSTAAVNSGASSFSIDAVGNGWFRCSITQTLPAGTNYPAIISTPFASSISSTGNGTSGIYIWGAQLETGSTASTYQRITDGVQDYYAYQAQPVLFQDSAGTTPVTAVEQPVGLMLDKSKGLVLGSELVTNGDFSGGTTGWQLISAAVSITGGAFVFDGATSITASTVAAVGAAPSGQVTAGRWYKVTYTILSSTTLPISVGFQNNTGTLRTDAGTYSEYILAANTGDRVAVWARGTTGARTGSIDNISVRELPGNHAFQTTSTSRPVLSARYNLLTKTEQFDDAVWIKDAGITAVTPNYSTAPDGTTTSTRIVFSGSNQLIRQAFSAITGIQYTSNVWLKGAAGTTISVATAGTDELVTLTGGWQQYSGTKSFTSANFIINTYSGATARDIQVWHPDIRAANDAAGQPAYQRVNTATDYDTAGFKPYLRRDGTDDFLQTNSINFTGTDKITVVAGVRKLSDAAGGIVAELSASRAANNGAFTLSAPNITNDGNYAFISRGTSDSGVNLTGYSAPITNVLTGIGDIAGDLAILRVNGAEAGRSTADQGTGNYGNYPLFTGRRGGTTLPANTRDYGLIIVGRALTASEIANTEKWMAGKTGATLA